MEHRKLFIGMIAASGALHVVILAGVSIPEATPPTVPQQMVVILPPAPQPIVDPEPEVLEDVLPDPPIPPPVRKPEPPVDELAVPDETLKKLDRYEPPLMTTPPPPMPPPSEVTLPVIPQRTAPGDPTNEAIVRAWLERFKQYPRIAVVRRMQGNILLYLKIASDGTVLTAAIRESSWHRPLDDEVMSMVKRASPFPLREGTETATEYLIPIEFTLE